MNSQLIIYFLIISLVCKVNAYDDTNGLIDILSQNKHRMDYQCLKVIEIIIIISLS